MTTRDPLIGEFADLLGDADVLTGELAADRQSVWATHQPCHARALLRPGSTEQVSKIMRMCHAAGQSVVP